MLPLEAARRALQLTRLEGLAASTAFLNTDDEAAAAMTQDDVDAAVGAVWLYLWCMGLGAFRTLTYVDHLAFIDISDIGLCLLYFSCFPALTSVVLLFVGILYWQDGNFRRDFPDAHPDGVQARLWTRIGQVRGCKRACGRVRMTAFILYLVAVLHAYSTWWHPENHATLWENPWVIAAIRAAITGVVGCFVQKLKSEHPDAHDGHLASFYGTTYNIQNSWWPSQNSLWLLMHTMLRLLLHAELDLLKERSLICFVMTFAVIFVTVFVGLETHLIMIPSRSAPIGVAACLMPYDLFFLFCLTLAHFGWSYIYLNCLDFPLTFCLLASVYVIAFLKWGNLYYPVIARPCFGAMTYNLHVLELDSDTCSLPRAQWTTWSSRRTPSPTTPCTVPPRPSRPRRLALSLTQTSPTYLLRCSRSSLRYLFAAAGMGLSYTQSLPPHSRRSLQAFSQLACVLSRRSLNSPVFSPSRHTLSLSPSCRTRRRRTRRTRRTSSNAGAVSTSYFSWRYFSWSEHGTTFSRYAGGHLSAKRRRSRGRGASRPRQSDDRWWTSTGRRARP